MVFWKIFRFNEQLLMQNVYLDIAAIFKDKAADNGILNNELGYTRGSTDEY